MTRALASFALLACAPAPLVAQGIARDMGACLSMPFAYEHNAAALACMCRAEQRCQAAGLTRTCAISEWFLVGDRNTPIVVGQCQ